MHVHLENAGVEVSPECVDADAHGRIVAMVMVGAATSAAARSPGAILGAAACSVGAIAAEERGLQREVCQLAQPRKDVGLERRQAGVAQEQLLEAA